MAWKEFIAVTTVTKTPHECLKPIGRDDMGKICGMPGNYVSVGMPWVPRFDAGNCLVHPSDMRFADDEENLLGTSSQSEFVEAEDRPDGRITPGNKEK